MGRPVTHWQIVSNTPEKTAAFYTRLFDWTVRTDNPLGFQVVDTGSERGIGGGIWPAPPQATAFVQLFVEVDDVAAAAKRWTELGGRLIVPPTELPDGDALCIAQDPEGISMGLYRAKATKAR